MMHFAFYTIIILCTVRIVFSSEKESELIEKLLKNYNPHSRPVANPSFQLDLDLKLTLKQIIDLDVRNQILKTKLWLEYYWKDEKLIWEPVSLPLWC